MSGYTLEPQVILRKVGQNPKKSIDAARRGSRTDLMEVANVWQELGPQMLRLGVIDALLAHLTLASAPAAPQTPAANSDGTADFAFMALLGLGKAGPAIGDGLVPEQTLVRAWPGVFKWSQTLQAIRVNEPGRPAEARRAASDVTLAAWSAFSGADSVREAMIRTPGSVELAVELWLGEDWTVNTLLDVPAGPAALERLLRGASKFTLDRVVRAASGKADVVAKRAIRHYRDAYAGPRVNPVSATICADLLCMLSRVEAHPLRHGLLKNGAVPLVVRGLHTLAVQLAGGEDVMLAAMVGSFGYLWNVMESTDGFTWVREAVQAGLSSAYVNCSPHFAKLVPEDLDMVVKLFGDLVPRYTVYRSVVETLVPEMAKVQNEPFRSRAGQSVVGGVWVKFRDLVAERHLVASTAQAAKGKAATCDNINCNKVNDRKNFQKCAGCQTSLYCSKECQVTAWKDGDHKTVCKLKQQEQIEGKRRSISKSDKYFLHALAGRDARTHLPQLRTEACASHPESDAFVVCIDYTRVPETYSVRPATEGVPEDRGNARTDAMLAKARAHPERCVLIESTVSGGVGLQLVLTMVSVSRSFWAAGDEDVGDGKELEWRIDEEDGDGSDDADEEAEGRADLLWLAKRKSDAQAHREEPTGDLSEAKLQKGRFMLDSFVEKLEGKRPFGTSRVPPPGLRVPSQLQVD